MDWSSRVKLRLFLTGVVLFLVSGFYSCQECKYALVGKKAPARVTRIKEYQDYGGDSPSQRTAVEFEFTDNRGLTRQGKDTFDGRIDAAEGDPIEVQYRAGADGAARVAGHANTPAVYLFVICLLAMGALSYPLVRETYVEVYAPKKNSAWAAIAPESAIGWRVGKVMSWVREAQRRTEQPDPKEKS